MFKVGDIVKVATEFDYFEEGLVLYISEIAGDKVIFTVGGDNFNFGVHHVTSTSNLDKYFVKVKIDSIQEALVLPFLLRRDVVYPLKRQNKELLEKLKRYEDENNIQQIMLDKIKSLLNSDAYTDDFNDLVKTYLANFGKE